VRAGDTGPSPDATTSEPFGATVAELDDAFDRLLDRVRGNRAIDRVMYTASAAGDWSIVWHVIGAVRFAADPSRRRESLRFATVLAAESLVVNQGVKRLFMRVRPAADPDRSHPHTLRQPSTSSFPSGHASAAFCAATLLADTSSPVATVLWFSLATVVAVSRPYVRVHHVSDTVGGAVLGIVLGRLARRLWPI
jgi:undecaprenyl-diphosphatase